MSNAYAEFYPVSSANFLRKDTRLYLSASSSYTKASGTCKGIVWLCNPGSATGSSSWGPCTVDKTLGVVLDVFSLAAQVARGLGKCCNPDDYLQILNLHYLCDAKLMRGWTTSWGLPSYSETPQNTVLFRWIAWGDVPHALLLQAAPLVIGGKDYFFYDVPSKLIQTNLSCLNYPLHPYGALRHSHSHPNYIHLLAHHIAPKL